jgi:hypothetical protein
MASSPSRRPYRAPCLSAVAVLCLAVSVEPWNQPDAEAPWYATPSAEWEETPSPAIRFPDGAFVQDLSSDASFQLYWWPQGAAIPLQRRSGLWEAVLLSGRLHVSISMVGQPDRVLVPDTHIQIPPRVPHRLRCLADEGCGFLARQAGLRYGAELADETAPPRPVDRSRGPLVLPLVASGYYAFRAEPQLLTTVFSATNVAPIAFFAGRASYLYRLPEGGRVPVRTWYQHDTGIVLSGVLRIHGEALDFPDLVRPTLFHLTHRVEYSWHCVEGPCLILHPQLAHPHVTD